MPALPILASVDLFGTGFPQDLVPGSFEGGVIEIYRSLILQSCSGTGKMDWFPKYAHLFSASLAFSPIFLFAIMKSYRSCKRNGGWEFLLTWLPMFLAFLFIVSASTWYSGLNPVFHQPDFVVHGVDTNLLHELVWKWCSGIAVGAIFGHLLGKAVASRIELDNHDVQNEFSDEKQGNSSDGDPENRSIQL